MDQETTDKDKKLIDSTENTRTYKLTPQGVKNLLLESNTNNLSPSSLLKLMEAKTDDEIRKVIKEIYGR